MAPLTSAQAYIGSKAYRHAFSDIEMTISADLGGVKSTHEKGMDPFSVDPRERDVCLDTVIFTSMLKLLIFSAPHKHASTELPLGRVVHPAPE
ncbi:hypothetical protein RhiJN_28516 [Ceratobasidium sp. AG-Ba]|nr:hypothetical protein RhiJN_28516 [Ceratobasidium sp. AG-Ba]